MEIYPQHLTLFSETFAICRLPRDTPLPTWVHSDGFLSITRTSDELSIVCPDAFVPDGVQAEKGWCALKLRGPFPFELVGILNSVTIPLAEARIGIFAVSTYDTDWVLLKTEQRERALRALRIAGHTVQES